MPTTQKLREVGNALLDRLPAAEFDLLEPMLQRVELAHGQVIYQVDAEMTHVYFPTTSLSSLLLVMEEDDPVEVAPVGREGLIGLTVAMGVLASPHRVICQMAGGSLRLPVQPFLDALARGPVLTRLAHRFVAYSLRVISQSVACNALHPVEGRASRWLLMVHDQAQSDEFPLTQEFLAFMLGVRRQTVTVVAGSLQNAGLIGYRRGRITVRDRPRLEEAACECYAAMGEYYRRVLF